MIRSNEIDLNENEPDDRQQFVWKSVLVLLCIGLFALVMWAGSQESEKETRCAKEEPAARQSCMSLPNVQAQQPPAKGALSPLGSHAIDHRTN